jgi:hypothetical protein
VLDRLTVDDFQPLTGEVFHVTELGIDLRLERVTQVMESERARLKRQPFSLFFRGPSTPRLPQGSYSLEQAHFSEGLTIFIVPVGRNDEGVEYEAVFT